MAHVGVNGECKWTIIIFEGREKDAEMMVMMMGGELCCIKRVADELSRPLTDSGGGITLPWVIIMILLAIRVLL